MFHADDPVREPVFRLIEFRFVSEFDVSNFDRRDLREFEIPYFRLNLIGLRFISYLNAGHIDVMYR